MSVRVKGCVEGGGESVCEREESKRREIVR